MADGGVWLERTKKSHIGGNTGTQGATGLTFHLPSDRPDQAACGALTTEFESDIAPWSELTDYFQCENCAKSRSDPE